MTKVTHKQIYADYPSCSVAKSAAQSISNDDLQNITWDVENWDNGGCHSTSSNSERFTAPEDGIYQLCGKFAIAATSPTYYSVGILKNGSSYNNRLTNDYAVATQRALEFSVLMRMEANDYAVVQGRCQGGSSRSFVVSKCFAHFSKVAD